MVTLELIAFHTVSATVVYFSFYLPLFLHIYVLSSFHLNPFSPLFCCSVRQRIREPRVLQTAVGDGSNYPFWMVGIMTCIIHDNYFKKFEA